MATPEIQILDDAPALDPNEGSTEPAQQLDIFDPLAAGENLAKESMVLELHVHAPGWNRSIDPEAIMDKKFMENGADSSAAAKVEDGLAEASVQELVEEAQATGKTINPRRLRASKEIIDKKELRPLHKFIGKMIGKIKNQRCLASNLLAPGMYILPLKLVNEVDQTIEELKAGITSHLNQLEPRYNEIIEKAKVDLGPQFDQKDYLSFSEVRAAYSVTSRYLSFNVPAALATVNKQLFEKALEESKQERAEMAQVIRDGMRGGFLKLVTHFSEVLGKDPESGKPKVFHASTAEKLKDFCTTLESRDLTDDTDLRSLARKVHDLVDGVDPKSIRSDEALRDALEKQFNQIVEKATAMVQTRERKLAIDRDI